ncbi:hypothetical protein SPBR_07249 [Sporothrix brasiliensis 5110]|uniref:Uncharacterized protein n=1 Tax=Sporothrix brasiliensis 5110 TaxID=1398154 RepID=A0A0C2FE63_9PEZI|nr:uncharacterized protein SPBR_07249 [Sporothrix brasiliensis 5110]KIH89433.1 hypothetical protein SPBR_07249 [Sporothrix brasiliensis 5110]
MATTPIAAATPSPPPHIHTPPTPRLGFADSWEPFSPRKSSRIAAASKNASRSAAARTPSPSAAARQAVRQPRSPRLAKQAAPTQHQHNLQPHPQHLDVATFSPAPTPRKKKTMPTAHFLSPEDALKSNKSAAGGESSTYGGRMGAGMLPTPAKTPSKKVHAASQNESNIAAIARNLFHTNVDEVIASPSKTPSRKGKKYTGFSLESFTEVQEEEPIPIFTDSQDRVPEADTSAENPFFGDGATATSPPEPTRRRSKRNQVSIKGEGKQTVEEATRREDGLVYVFRGKKIFRKFEDSADAQEEDILEGLTSGADKGKRLTRSAIKPRLLFPREDSSFAETTPNGGTTEDEEADTDIEESNTVDSDGEAEAEDDKLEPTIASAPNTPPPAPKFAAPASPPTTTRTRRSGQKSAEELTPIKATSVAAPKKRSPFDGWRQTKSSVSAAAGHKRTVDALGSSPSAAAKRSRV